MRRSCVSSKPKSNQVFAHPSLIRKMRDKTTKPPAQAIANHVDLDRGEREKKKQDRDRKEARRQVRWANRRAHRGKIK